MPDEEQMAEAVPREERVAQYPLIRRNFEAALEEPLQTARLSKFRVF
jgi:hypothetical protein